MGLTIHYSGQISNYNLIDDLIKEVGDINKDLGWSFTIINDEKLKGIWFGPEGSEPVWLTFDPSGRLCSPASILVAVKNDPFYYTSFTKTQYAGPDAHMVIIKLLHYLAKKYFSSFVLIDEGMYWETMEEKVLRNQFAKYEFALNAVTAALSSMKFVPGETPISLAERIEVILKKGWIPDRLKSSSRNARHRGITNLINCFRGYF